MPDKMFGEKACAFLIMDEGRDAPSVKQLGEFLLQTGIAKFKLPEWIEVIKAFLVTKVGKVERAQMRAIAARLVDAGHGSGVSV